MFALSWWTPSASVARQDWWRWHGMTMKIEPSASLELQVTRFFRGTCPTAGTVFISFSSRTLDMVIRGYSILGQGFLPIVN